MRTSPPRRQDGLARQKSHAIKTRSPPSSSHKFANLRDPFIYSRKMLDIVVPSDAALCQNGTIPPKLRSRNAAHTQATRNYFQKSAMPSESVSLLTLMQASFQRAAEKLFQ